MTAERVWTKITHVENIPLREGRPVRVGDLEIAIFNLNGRFVTIENACPHKGGPLCDGIVTGTAVVCPLHGRHFDLETGMPVRAAEPSCVAVFPTRVKDGIILVDVEGGYRAVDDAREDGIPRPLRSGATGKADCHVAAGCEPGPQL